MKQPHTERDHIDVADIVTDGVRRGVVQSIGEQCARVQWRDRLGRVRNSTTIRVKKLKKVVESAGESW